MARRLLIAGNWKMYKTVGEARQFITELHRHLTGANPPLPEILVCPPFTALQGALQAASELGAPVHVGAQTMESREEGAYTGEISPVMLKDMGVDFVIIGHSERREYYNETDHSVNAKVHAALKHQLTPIICVGESLEQRESGQTDAHVEQQVRVALNDVSPSDYPKLVFAYEPIWAIGTGKTCEAAEADRVCGLIRNVLNDTGNGDTVRILYGGSMKPENSLELLKKTHIDGGLIGGASLKPDSFFEIIRHAVETGGTVSV